MKSLDIKKYSKTSQKASQYKNNFNLEEIFNEFSKKSYKSLLVTQALFSGKSENLINLINTKHVGYNVINQEEIKPKDLKLLKTIVKDLPDVFSQLENEISFFAKCKRPNARKLYIKNITDIEKMYLELLSISKKKNLSKKML